MGMFAFSMALASVPFLYGQYYIQEEVKHVNKLRQNCINSGANTFSRQMDCNERYPSYDGSDVELISTAATVAIGLIGGFSSKQKIEQHYYVLKGSVKGYETVHIKIGNDSRFRPRSSNRDKKGNRFAIVTSPQKIGVGLNVKF